MNLKAASLGIVGKILMLFIVINIVGDVGNVLVWWTNPSTRALSLNTGYIGVAAGAEGALIAGTVILLVVAVVYVVALFGLMRRQNWAPLLVIAISVANRVLALFLYAISAAFLLWAVWTVILVVLAYLVWRKMNKPLSKLWGSGASSRTNN